MSVDVPRIFLAAVAALTGGAIIVGATLAAATPVTPSPGATVNTAHPRFSWTLPAGEQSQSIYIAEKPDVTPEGRFYDQNIVALGVLAPGDREWTPSSPLYAGSYWWNIWSSKQNDFVIFSAPVAFKIPVSLRLRGIRTKRYLSSHVLEIGVRWTANVQRPLIRVQLLRGRRVIWKASRVDYNLAGSVGSTTFTWSRPRRIRQGTRLRLRASISSGGVARTGFVVVRAP